MDKSLAIVFDLDDTLYSKSQVFAKTIQEFGQTSLSPTELYQIFAKASDRAFEQMRAGQLDLHQSHLQRTQETFDALGFPSQEDSLEAFIQAYQDNLDNIRLSPEWQEALTYLQSQGYPLAILTNGPGPHQRRKLQKLGIDQWIDEKHWFISEEIGHAKPSRQAFGHVQDHMEQAQAWLMVGDSIWHDIKGSLGAEWDAIHFGTHGLGQDIDCPSVHSPKDLVALIQAL